MSSVEGASGGSLGNLATSASGVVAARASARHVTRWRLREAIAELLPGARMTECMNRAVPNMVPTLKVGASGAYVAHTRRCGSVWTCPYCAAKIARGRAEELRRAIAAAEERGLVVTLATFTVGHTADDELPELLDGLTEAMRRWRSGRSWQRLAAAVGYVGAVRNLEVTWGAGSGWHPHSHVLLFTRERVVGTSWAATMGVRWADAVARSGGYASDLHGLRFSDSEHDVKGYLTKVDREVSDGLEQARSWAAAEELTFSHAKVGRGSGRLNAWTLAMLFRETGDQEMGDRFVQFAAAFHGRRHLVWSRGLRDSLGLGVEASDVELAEAAGEVEQTVYELSERELQRLVASCRLGELLEVAESRGAGAAWLWCMEFFGRAREAAAFESEWWTQDGWTE